MTVAVTDGRRLWAFRCASRQESRSLYYSSRVETLRALHPGLPFLREASEDTRLIVSEPLGNLPGVWNKVPESSYGVVQPEGDVMLPFVPRAV
jgi:predicted glutamine amidotransferase